VEEEARPTNVNLKKRKSSLTSNHLFILKILLWFGLYYLVLYILHTTGQCNLKCRYCGGSFPQNVVPWQIKYPINRLKRFVSDDPEPIIAFYGGEPLLNVKFIEDVMNEFSDARFVI